MNEHFELAAGPLTASMVVSSAGSAISDNGTSRGLGNKSDLALLKWFRSRSQIVLTSGKTAELENYRFPSSTGLAILSRSQRSYDSLGKEKERVLFLDVKASFSQAVLELKSQGYQRIHCEFGPSGFVELVQEGTVDGFVSSIEVVGIERFAELHHLVVEQLQQLTDDLFVGKLLGRG